MDRDRGVNEPRGAGFERVEHGGLETEPVATRVREDAPEAPRQDRNTDLAVRRDSARWGPIWAGLMAAITTFLLLELLAFGLGLLTPNLTPGQDNTASVWVSGVIGLIAFFTGGSVAGMTSAVRGTATGLLNGFLVWALGTVLILALSVLGLGQAFGALGNVVGQFSLLQGALGVPGANIDPQQILDTLRTAALGGFFSLLVSALASTIGGWLGGRTNHPIGHMVHEDRG